MSQIAMVPPNIKKKSTDVHTHIYIVQLNLNEVDRLKQYQTNRGKHEEGVLCLMSVSVLLYISTIKPMLYHSSENKPFSVPGDAPFKFVTPTHKLHTFAFISGVGALYLVVSMT